MADAKVRSGSELRKRAQKVQISRAQKYVCPRTGKTVRRVSNAIWESTGGYVFAGGTYTLTTPSGEVLERMLKDHATKVAKR